MSHLRQLGLTDKEYLGQIKATVEAILFAAGEPLTSKKLQTLMEIPEADIYAVLEELKEDMLKEDRGVELLQVASGYQIFTKKEFGSFIERLIRPKRQKLSAAAMEVLAIVAYRQPRTKAEIDDVRGVNSEGALSTLVEKGLVEEVGRKEGPGRPILYGTTQEFLRYFGLTDLIDLPLEKTFMAEAAASIEEE